MTTPNFLDTYDGEVYLYYGDITRNGYRLISDTYEQRAEKKSRVCLVLVSYGGDADAAYRIARATNHHFERIEVLIPDICKSAGTLLCIGAHALIFGDRGELGPLDIQLSKPDEMFESMSGLDIIQAINALQNQVLDSFRTYLIDIRAGSRIRTKTAADVATKLANEFVAPIAAKIDPLTLGEHQRAMQIAYDYGERLSNMTESLKANALVRLVSDYPSHGFVIDRKEAGELFNDVSAPKGPHIEIYSWARQVLAEVQYPVTPIVLDVKEASRSQVEKQPTEKKGEGANHDDREIEEHSSSADGTTEQEGEGDESNARKSA